MRFYVGRQFMEIFNSLFVVWTRNATQQLCIVSAG